MRYIYATTYITLIAFCTTANAISAISAIPISPIASAAIRQANVHKTKTSLTNKPDKRTSKDSKASVPDNTPKSETFLIDRFGNIYISKKKIDIDTYLQNIDKSTRSINKIYILYTPFTFEFDKQNLLAILKSHFPNADIELKPAKQSEYPKLFMQKNNTKLLKQMLAHRNNLLQMLAQQHEYIFTHVQSYLSKLQKQIEQITGKLSTLHKEYETMTQHKEDKANE